MLDPKGEVSDGRGVSGWGAGVLGLTEAGVLRYNRAVVGEKFGARFGAWPSGKAPGFGPGIAGSNPAAPAEGYGTRPRTRRSSS